MTDSHDSPITYSVVIPLYNKGPHVERAITSALAQTEPPHQIVVVDDGSTDGGLEAVRAMADPRILVLTRSPPGPGGYAARNLGIEHATGSWVAFLDADDCWYPQHLADLSAAIRGCDGATSCAFSHFMVREEGKDRRYRMADDILRPGGANDLATFLRAWLATERCPMWTGAVAFRRSLLMEAGMFPAGRARRGGDKDLWLRCMLLSPAAYAPAVSAEFHQDTVNRVTVSTSHTELPIVCATIAEALPRVGPVERRLLKALSNQEVALYVRHAAKVRSRTGLGFVRRLYLPQGAGWLALMLGYMTVGAMLRRFDRKGRIAI